MTAPVRNIIVHADPPRARLNLRGLDLATAQSIHDMAAALRYSPSEYFARLHQYHLAQIEALDPHGWRSDDLRAAGLVATR